MRSFHIGKPDSIDIVFDKEDQNFGHALIRGPDETPYEKGFFYFSYKYIIF